MNWLQIINMILLINHTMQDRCTRDTLRFCSLEEINDLVKEETEPSRKECVATGRRRYTGAIEYDCGGYLKYLQEEGRH